MRREDFERLREDLSWFLTYLSSRVGRGDVHASYGDEDQVITTFEHYKDGRPALRVTLEAIHD